MGLIAKGCPQIGGWYGGLLPANIVEPGLYIANRPHKQQKVDNSPTIRMETAHRGQLNSTGSDNTAINWHATRRVLINQSRITEAMRVGTSRTW